MLTADQKTAFDRDGYLILPRLIPAELVRDLRAAAETMAAAEPEATRRTWHERACFRRAPFRSLLQYAPLVDAAESLIGADVQLLALDLLMIRAGMGNIGWHRDVSFVCDKTLSINCGVYLQEMTETNGALRLVPASHRRAENPPAGADSLPGEVWATVPAGSAVFFDAALWHTAGKNNSAFDRYAVFPYWGHYFVKRMDESFTQALPAELAHSPDARTRQLFGGGLRPGALNYHGDGEGYNRERGEAGVDFAGQPCSP